MQPERSTETARLSALLESLPCPALIVDRRRRVRAVNATLRARVPGPMVTEGLRCYELLHGRHRRCPSKKQACPLDQCLETGDPVPAVHSHVVGRRTRRERILLRPLVEDDGQVVACLATLEPVGPVRAREWRAAGRSAVAVDAVRAQLSRLARGRSAILLVGEAGTGKASVARAIHRLSRSRGCFEERSGGELTAEGLRALLASGSVSGSLYLSDVHALDREAQDALRERLTRPVGRRRLILGTDRDLAERTAAGRFDADLLAMLAGHTLRLPPLRDRRGELPGIAARLLGEAEGPGRTLAPEALERLLRYPFPGNLAELAQALGQASLLASGPTVRVEDLPEKMRGARPE